MGRERAVLALGLALAGCAPAARGAPDDVIPRILPSTVQLRAERADGGRRAASGVVLASDAARGRSWILTTRHLLHPAVPDTLSLGVPGRAPRVGARLAAASDDVDLAVIEVDGPVLPPVTLQDHARLGDDVWIVAFPWGRRRTVVRGVVSQLAAESPEAALEGPVRMVDASVSYGASGGGVFDAASGNLVGIVEGDRTARLTLPDRPERSLDLPVPGETTVISSEAIARFLRAAGLAWLLDR